MIRTREWKYVHRYPYGPHELYDLVNDPGERSNLVEDRSRKALIANMRLQMSAWFDRYVLPGLDGARFPVTGGGQAAKVGEGQCGEGAFFPRYDPPRREV